MLCHSAYRHVVIAAAIVLGVPALARAQNDPETALYTRATHSVFKVQAGLSHGSGFLVDTLGGLIVTNAHVLQGTSDVSVFLDAATRVPAQIVEQDEDADLALLRIDMTACAGCAGLSISRSGPRPGQHVVALGFPRHEPLSITAGIVSTVRDGAVISDAVINPGNSGGPVLNMDGEVIGVSTFADQGDVGPGLSGAISADRIEAVIAKAPQFLLALGPAPTGRLAVLVDAHYPLAALKALVDTASQSAFPYLAGIDVGPFVVTMSTPIAARIEDELVWHKVARDRERREYKANAPANERFDDPNLAARDWEEVIGRATPAVIAVDVQPKESEVIGSALGRGAAKVVLGVDLMAHVTFDGDVQGVTLRRNGVPVPPLVGGHRPKVVFFQGRWVEMTDVADYGYYVYPATVLGPDTDGRQPTITIEIADLKHPGKPASTTLDSFLEAKAWNDLAGYYAVTHAEYAFRAYRFREDCTSAGMGGNAQKTCTTVVDQTLSR